MIFEPEYCGVCSCRIVRALSVKTIALPSGDQLSPPIAWVSPRSTSDSLPSARDRIIRSPPAVPAPPRPARPPASALDPGAAVGAGLTKAALLPSGEGVMFDSACGVDHTADGSPPATGTCHRSPRRGKYTR